MKVQSRLQAPLQAQAQAQAVRHSGAQPSMQALCPRRPAAVATHALAVEPAHPGWHQPARRPWALAATLAVHVAAALATLAPVTMHSTPEGPAAAARAATAPRSGTAVQPPVMMLRLLPADRRSDDPVATPLSPLLWQPLVPMAVLSPVPVPVVDGLVDASAALGAPTQADPPWTAVRPSPSKYTVTRGGQAVVMNFPDAPLTSATVQVHLELQLSAQGRVLSVSDLPGQKASAFAETARESFLGADIQGPATASSDRLCLRVNFEEEGNQVSWQLGEPKGSGGCRGRG